MGSSWTNAARTGRVPPVKGLLGYSQLPGYLGHRVPASASRDAMAICSSKNVFCMAVLPDMRTANLEIITFQVDRNMGTGSRKKIFFRNLEFFPYSQKKTY